MGRAALASLFGAALGIGLACSLPFDDGISCGDGYVDLAAGEQCDPLVPGSWDDACLGTMRPYGEGACDEVACSLRTDAQVCGTCGDGVVDIVLGEQCDGAPVGAACPSGRGTVRCEDCRLSFADCDPCGNALVDEGEECDPAATTLDDFAGTLQCAGTLDLDNLEGQPPLPPPEGGKPYASGTAGSCRDDCRWSRAGCGFCGDGVVDIATLVDAGLPLPEPEVCDGTSFHTDAFAEGDAQALFNVCADESDALDVSLRPAVTCDDDCTSVIVPPRDEPDCCVLGGGRCIEEYPCCSATTDDDGCVTWEVRSGPPELRCRPG